MEALAIDKNGVCALVDVPKPQVKRGQVLIEVKAASLNKADYATHDTICEGRVYAESSGVSIAGSDAAGVVRAVAPDVMGFEPGDRVCAVCKGLSGAVAQFAVADAKWTAKIPESMTFSQAAAIPTAGVTALAAVKKAQLAGGKRVLVCGASGGVGQYATVFAAQAGAVVDAACSSANAGVPKICGAARVFDYKSGLSELPAHAYDAVLAVNGKFPSAEYARVLKRGGAYVAVGMDSIRPAIAMPLKGRHAKLAVFFAEIGRGGLAEAVQRAGSSKRSIAITEHEGLKAAPSALLDQTRKRSGTKHVVVIG